MPQSTTWKNNKFKIYSRFYYKGFLLYWILLIIIIISLILLPIIKVDVSTQSRGIIKTINKISPIYPGISSKVAFINIRENQTVSKGDTLLILEQKNIDSEVKIAKNQIDTYQSYLNDIDVLINDKNKKTHTPLYTQEEADYTNEIKKRKRTIEKRKIDFNRTQKLYKEDVVPISKLQEDSFLLKTAEDELLIFKTSTRAKWELDKKNFTIDIQDLEVKIENLLQQKNKLLITAPFDGNIISFNGIAKGSIVNENEVIAMISPVEDLLAECYVSPSDIGLIQENMPVKIQVDSYNYNQWGLMHGVVISISHDVINHDGVFVYVVKSKMKSNYLILNNGLKGQLKKGMSITGRFIVTQRSLFQLLFDNINDWLNPKITHLDTK